MASLSAKVVCPIGIQKCKTSGNCFGWSRSVQDLPPWTLTYCCCHRFYGLQFSVADRRQGLIWQDFEYRPSLCIICDNQCLKRWYRTFHSFEILTSLFRFFFIKVNKLYPLNIHMISNLVSILFKFSVNVVNKAYNQKLLLTKFL